jgi:lipopolysaccharide/colanic/teichoic acid biosynthesis glycosyltransferase
LLGPILLVGSMYIGYAFPRLQLPALGVADIVILFVGWSISIILTHKHRPKFYQVKIKYITAPFIKAGMIMLGVEWLLCRMLNANKSSESFIVTMSLFYIVIEMSIIIIWCYVCRPTTRPTDETLKCLFSDRKQMQIDLIKNNEDNIAQTVTLESVHRSVVTEPRGEIIEFIKHNIPVMHIENDAKYGNMRLLITGERLNDVEDLNRFLSSCYDRVMVGGWIICKYKDMDVTIDEWRRKHQGILFYYVYVSQVLLQRFLWAMPGFKWVDSAMTKGRGRLLPRVEAWGRLSYNGFDVVREKRIGDEQYIIARKTKTPSDNPNPSCSPLISLDRIGLYGKMIKIHKVRTMYPYSEYLQKQVFEENQLASSGKINNDYRITRAGSILRKYWVDEVPQFIDWFRGEIKLVGIRAMSLHFFSLYPREYQELFIKVKPGIFSPVFDEETVDFSQIVGTEAAYLRSYQQRPVRTDIIYFFRTICQILFQGTRSR